MKQSPDRRRNPRNIRVWSGRLLIDGLVLDCAVSNVAEKGLKVITETGVDLPEEALIEYPDGSTRRCSVRWRRQNEAGLSLLD